MTRLAGKVVIITGATSGIGRASAARLCAEGARVVLTGRRTALGETAAREIVASGGEAMFQTHDVTREDSWTQLLCATTARWGRLDALVNNAGESVRRPIGELTADDLRFQLAVNLEGPFLGMRAAFPVLRKSGGGVIVNVGSVAGLRPASGSTTYAATKAALTHMSKAAAAEGGAASPVVRVNMLQPGLTWSESVVETLGAERAATFRAYILGRTPLKSVGAVEDMAAALAYMVSDSARSMSGAEVVVDGGLSLN